MKNLPGGDGIVVGSVTKTDPEKKKIIAVLSI